MINKSSLNSKVLQSGTIFSLILLTTSLLSTSYIQNSKALVQEDDQEDYGYLKFASYAVKQAYAAKQNYIVNSTIHIPPIARGPQIPAKGYLVQEIRGVIAVDAPPIIGKDYLIAIAEVTKEPVKIVIYTHAHMDHIGKPVKPLVGITKR